MSLDVTVGEDMTLHDVVAERPAEPPCVPSPLAVRAVSMLGERDRVAVLEDRNLAAQELGLSLAGVDARRRRAHRRLQAALAS